MNVNKLNLNQQFSNSFNVHDVQNPAQRTPFPLPPMAYVSKYTNSAVANGTVPRPPLPLSQSSVFMSFGDPYFKDDHVLRSLESQGQHRLYPQVYDHKKELKKLNISVVANFLELLQIISQEPGSPKRSEKIDHIATIFINMHHLLNEYRPHQARDTLREILKSQIESAKKTNEKAKEYNEKSNDLINKLKKELNGHFCTQKSVSHILRECELNNFNENNREPDSIKSEPLKRKFDNFNFSENSINIKIKKEAKVSMTSPPAKKNFIISENVRDTRLWQQLFDDLE